jgi:hypothetical protein
LLAAVRNCFDEYNKKGGAILRLQEQNLVYFPRACIYAVYADHPAAVKCTLTHSCCPVCYTRMRDMASTKTNQMVYRNDRDMAEKKRKYLNIINDPARSKIARKAKMSKNDCTFIRR